MRRRAPAFIKSLNKLDVCNISRNINFAITDMKEYYTEFKNLYKIMCNGIISLNKLMAFEMNKEEIKYISDEKEIINNITKIYNTKYGSDYLGAKIEPLPEMKYDYKKYIKYRDTKIIILLKKLMVITNSMMDSMNEFLEDVDIDFEVIKKCNKHDNTNYDFCSYKILNCCEYSANMYDILVNIFDNIPLLVNTETRAILNSIMDRINYSIINGIVISTRGLKEYIQNIDEEIYDIKCYVNKCSKCLKLSGKFWKDEMRYVNDDYKEIIMLCEAMKEYWSQIKKIIER